MAAHRPKGKRGGPRPRPKLKKVEKPEREDNRFRVLIAVRRPRYRSRSERAVDIPGWEVRSLLNKEDPIGLLNQKPPHILILSADFGRNKTLGFMKAAQRFRSDKTMIIGVFEEQEDAAEAAELCDAVFFPPWKSAEMRIRAAALFREITGVEAVLPVKPEDSPDVDERE
jgi:hypothetical protein